MKKYPTFLTTTPETEGMTTPFYQAVLRIIRIHEFERKIAGAK